MERNKFFNFSFNYTIVLLFMYFLSITTIAFSANFPLEITNIKPAGTGNPAIPSTNRIFRAYPGIEYNIRAAVIGGVYPYTYSLSKAPSGMTINADTGEISWPNPQADSGSITLTVKDSEDTTVTTNWAISVSTNGFLFVNASYSSNETGSITQPYKSLINMLNGTNSSNETDIVYFRDGNYQLAAFNATGGAVSDITGKLITKIIGWPYTWIGYPNETVNIDADKRLIRSHKVYFDNLNLTNFSDYGITLQSEFSYNTIRRCNWSHLVNVRSSNNNQGFIFTWNGGDGYFFVIQDNSFSHWAGASAIGSLYCTQKVLIEDNYIHSTDGGGMNGINNGISPKYHTDYITIRSNIVRMASGSPFATAPNSGMIGSSNLEICHNFFEQSSGSRALVHLFNAEGYEAIRVMNNLFYHHNTAIGNIVLRFIEGGPYNFYNNVIINPKTDYAGNWHSVDHFSYPWYIDMNTHPENYINDVNNLKGTAEDNIVDANGNLTTAYSSYADTHGHNSTGSTTPPASKPKAPSEFTKGN